jgi:hypothetical protein
MISNLPPVLLKKEVFIFLSSSETRNVLNTSKFLFASTKKEIIDYPLTKQSTKLFYQQESFQKHLLKELTNHSKQQIGLSFDYYTAMELLPKNFSDLNGLISSVSVSNLHFRSSSYDFLHGSIVLNQFTNISKLFASHCGFHENGFNGSFFPHLKDLTIQYSPLKRLTHVSHVEKVLLISCYGLSSLCSDDDVAGIRSLTIETCNELTCIEGLKNHSEVIFRCCDQLEDLSSLSFIERLTVDTCRNVEKVTTGNGIKKMKIINCPIQHQYQDNLTRMSKNNSCSSHSCDSPASTSYDLDFSVESYNHLSLFKAASKVSLTRGYQILDVSPLSAVHSVSLIRFPQLVEISSLSSVRHLTIIHCDKIEDISKLGNHQSITLGYCNRIKDFSSLKHVKKVKIVNCQYFNDLQPLSGVLSLTLVHYNGSIERIPESCPSLEYFQLEHNYSVSSLSSTVNCRSNSNSNNGNSLRSFRDIHTVVFKHCSLLRDLEELEREKEDDEMDGTSIDSGSVAGTDEEEEGRGDAMEVTFDDECEVNDEHGGDAERSRCSGFKLHRVVLQQCSSVEDVTSLSFIPDVRIIECKKVSDITSLTNVKRLEVVRESSSQKIKGFGELKNDMTLWRTVSRR